MTTHRTLMIVIFLLLAVAALFIVNMMIGSVYIPFSALLNLGGVYREILVIIRLPEAIGAIIIGINLAVAGAVMQGTFRNPLADPYITGTASGAVLGAVVGIFASSFSAAFNALAIVLEPVFGFLGAMFATLLVVLFSRRGNWLTLVLAGIAVSILLSALVTVGDSYLLTKSPSSFSLFLLLFGSLGGLNWSYDLIIIIVSAPVLLFLVSSGRKLNIVMMGDEVAQSTGINAAGFRTRMLVGSAVITAVSLSFTGIIGFVGLIAPHLTRFLLRDVDNTKVLPVCGLVGAAVLLFANFASKVVIPETVVPITAITSLVGAPILIYFIKRGRYSAK